MPKAPYGSLPCSPMAECSMGYGCCQKSECAVSACRDRKLIVLIRFWASRCEWALLDFGSGGTSVRRIPIVWWEKILTRCAILAQGVDWLGRPRCPCGRRYLSQPHD